MYRRPLNVLGTNLHLVKTFEEVLKEVCRHEIEGRKGPGPRGCNVEFRVCRVRGIEARNPKCLGWRRAWSRFLRYLTCRVGTVVEVMDNHPFRRLCMIRHLANGW